MPSHHEQLFADHVAWLASVRAAHDQMMAAAAAETATGGATAAQMLGASSLAGVAQLEDRFDGALDLDFEEPVYRSMGGLSGWQRADEVDLDAEEPVYRSLGGLGGGEMPLDPVEPIATISSPRTWAQSMPPLVQRQRAFQGSLDF